MDDKRSNRSAGCGLAVLTAVMVLCGAGCNPEPDSRQIRLEGQRVMLQGDYRGARALFWRAHELVPEDPPNLHDLGDCCMYFAREQFAQRNPSAALRELDQAIAYYQRAVDAAPGFQAALLGKNNALELKGRYEEAVRLAEWAVEFVGPSARQQMFLAEEMEERGDQDAALLRLRQAVAMEPNNPAAHEALGELYLRLERRDLARAHLRRANALDPRRPTTEALLEQLDASALTAQRP